MAIKIKYASEEDLESISYLFCEILDSLKYYNEIAKQNEKSKYSTPELSKKLFEDKLSIITVNDNETLVGFCFSKYDDFTIWLEWFGIASSHRGAGIGDLILGELERSTLIRGCHKVWCDSRTDNIASLKVLQKNGYTLVTTLKNHWYNQDFFIWQKYLID